MKKAMTNTLKAVVAGAIVTVSLAMSLPASAKPAHTIIRDRVIFETVELGDNQNQYATVPVVVRETLDTRYPGLLGDYPIIKREVIEVSSQPLIVWQKTLASSDPKGAYTPKRRAEAVGARLTNLVAALGVSNLKEMVQVGIVNYEGVIFVSDESVADFNTVVFTLIPENRAKASQILTKLQEYGEATATTDPIYN
ncbi:COP23 domain-containing protein [Capilliphycus salinus ALCB114379]|uniref:COP23 domain-containing protein n=1 Tax=Capilliphycus salinus TaxID=2768948 RepID=UPI0039A70F1A